ncbi:MAG TPA: glycosyl hydrolase [Feifaniaceae bacterium]|nr:glycosyl hydrolase [Feifaniaceae bacterium]
MPNRCRKTIAFLISSILLIMPVLGCVGQEAAPEITPTPIPSPAPTESVPAPEPVETEPPLSAWAAYWDTERVSAELSLLAPELKSVSVFSALFRADGSLYVPEETAALLAFIQEQFGGTQDIYLTFVNDIARKGGGFSLKDTALLERLFADEERMDAHIKEMIALAQEFRCDGIELDYEAMRKVPGLWKPFAAFLGRLYDAAQEAGLLCRVVLEPSALCKAKYPEGPDYVLMCYNLYGSHSGPGPKADIRFLNALADESRDLLNLSFALSTGGFDWDEDGEAAQLTEREAETLRTAQGIPPERDEGSGALHFTYTAEDGTQHEVWYADGETLTIWMRAVKEKGVSRFAIWRAGGNTDEALQAVLDAAQG